MLETLDNIYNYTNRVLVCGSTTFTDYDLLSNQMDNVMLTELRGNTVFITSGCKRGTDAMIMAWCEKRRKPCVIMPNRWLEFGIRAGFICNAERADAATHLYIFYDGRSSGSRNMIWNAKKRNLTLKVYLFDPKNQPFENDKSNQKHLRGLRKPLGHPPRHTDQYKSRIRAKRKLEQKLLREKKRLLLSGGLGVID